MASTDIIKLVQKNLQVLGIDQEAAKAYIALLQAGPVSVLQLSKTTGVSRTQTYRHLEQLQIYRLVSVEQLSYGSLFRALPIENIEARITAKEAETAAVKHDLQAMADGLRVLTGAAGPQSTTLHYYGLGGLKQVSWNLTRADKEFKVFEAAHLSQHFDKDGRMFVRRCRERFIERQLTSYSLTNDTAVKAAGLEPFDRKRSFIRHIDPEILRINFEIYLYDQVVTLIDYSTEQPQATEIHHPALKTMMEQLFDSMWRVADPLEIN